MAISASIWSLLARGIFFAQQVHVVHYTAETYCGDMHGNQWAPVGFLFYRECVYPQMTLKMELGL